MNPWANVPRNACLGGLAAWRSGEGPDLVLIHGVGLRAEAWGGLVPTLARRFRCWAIDMPGHGESPQMDCRSISDFAEALDAALADIGGPVAVAGHSMGAMIALELAGGRKSRITGIAALNAIYRRSEQAAAAVQTRARALVSEPAPDPTATLERWFGQEPVGEMKAASDACQNWLTTCDRWGYARAYQVFAHHDGPTDHTLSSLPVPALFLTGSEEPNSTPEMSRKMAALAPRGRACIVKGAAHMAPMTHGTEVAGHLLGFLSECERSA